MLKQFGVPFELLDPAGCIGAEPALARVEGKIAGGLRLPGDETGDCRLFTERLDADLHGARRHLQLRRRDRAVCSAIGDRDRVAGVKITRQMEAADAYVVALGSYSARWMSKLGIRCPGLPGKGLFHHRCP